MAPLDRKLLRDIVRLKGQVLAIALVMASGVGVLVMSLTSIEALYETATAYYERYHFANVFVGVKRAPEHLAHRIRRLDGVQSVETRVVQFATLDIPAFEEPVIGQLVSVPERRQPTVNRLAIREGRLPRVAFPDEVVLSEPFANAHRLRLGESVRAIINGHWRELHVVGTALSPEFIYVIGPGALMPDDSRFGVIWMGHEALQAAYDLDGAFNDLSFSVTRGADGDHLIDQVDEILSTYGGTGAYLREDQISNWFLMNEIEQLKTLASILPTIFLAVAAYLTNMVLARLISVERSEIGLLKAFGYRHRDVAWHYVKLVLVIGAIGVSIGWVLGYWLGLYNTHVYAKFYHFPFLLFQPGGGSFVVAAIISLTAALFGALSSVRRAAALPPAESMRPPSPPTFGRSRYSGDAEAQGLDQPTRIILRQLIRWPMRSFATSAGIGMSVAVLISALQWSDALSHMVDVYFDQAQTQDVTVGFTEQRSSEVMRNLEALPGVMATEPLRAVSAKVRAGHRERREALQGVPARQRLARVYDASGRTVELPRDGLVMSTMLAEILAVAPGDLVTVEVLDGRRPVIELPVRATFETYIGKPVYMEIGALNRAMGERPSANWVHMKVDPGAQTKLFRELKEIPQVSAVTIKEAAIRTFHETMGETLLIFTSFFVVFSCALAFGVTYNAARVALSERGRELATLRVLGFTRGEISYLLLGETGLLTAAALPLGCLAGYGLVSVMMTGFRTELFRVPLYLEPSTFGWAMLIGLAATAASAFLVRRRLDRLDLIAVLKTRE